MKNKEHEKKGTSESNIYTKICDGFITGLENVFTKLGLLVGTHPWKTIVICVLLTGLCGAGMIKFKESADYGSLYVPSDSLTLKHRQWVKQTFPQDTHFVSVIFESENVLTPKVLQSMLGFYDKSVLLTTDTGKSFSSFCNRLGQNCHISSILDVWKNKIHNITTSQIRETIDSIIYSKTDIERNKIDAYLPDISIDSFLGGIVYMNGTVLSAKAAKMMFVVKGLKEDYEDYNLWENDILELGLNYKDKNVKLHILTTGSYEEEVHSTVYSDISLLSGGYVIVVIYVTVLISNFKKRDIKIGLALSGILTIGLSIVVSYGVCSMMGIVYGPFNATVPFLILGIGVDDMFVIVSALNCLSPQEKKGTIPDRLAATLKHAGVSITVTSITDVLVFGISATTNLPGLASFCLYVSIAVFALFALTSTFFVATMALDLRCVEANRKCLTCCRKDENNREEEAITRPLSKLFADTFGAFILKMPCKFIVATITMALLGTNIWGILHLEQDFDIYWVLPINSYVYKYNEISKKYFPGDGATTAVYCRNISYVREKHKLDILHREMAVSEFISKETIKNWYKAYEMYVNNRNSSSVSPNNRLLTSQGIHSINVKEHCVFGQYENITDSMFSECLYRFVTTTTEGAQYYDNLLFVNNNTIIKASKIEFKHKIVKNAGEGVKAMESVEAMIRSIFTDDECFAYGIYYISWETNKVIRNTLYRNLGLALICIFAVTNVFLANLWASLLVLLSIVMTLIDVAGTMYYWGLTINIITSVILIISVGLAVDYSAHMCHCFMTFKGSRYERLKATFAEMGVPVLSGGFSTFLAFLLLAGGSTYSFRTFFKLFFLIVLFGLFHGLVCLPVLLSVIGPNPYKSADRRYDQKSSKDTQSVYTIPQTDIKSFIQTNEKKIYIPPPDYTPILPRSKVLLRNLE